MGTLNPTIPYHTICCCRRLNLIASKKKCWVHISTYSIEAKCCLLLPWILYFFANNRCRILKNCLFCSFSSVFIDVLHTFGFQNMAAAAEAQWDESLLDATDQHPFMCPYSGCGHSFKYKCNLNVHQRKKHGGIYGSDQLVTFFCRASNCGRSFYSRGALAKHRRCIHDMYEEDYYGWLLLHWRFMQ